MFDRNHRLRRGLASVATVLVAAAAIAGCSDNENGQNSLDPKGPEANQILDLFTPFFWIAAVIGVGVIVGTFYVALRFRQKPGEERNPKQVHGNTVLEISWTIVPALILAVMAVFTVPVIFDLAERVEGEEVVNITVTGRQWFWEYEYVDDEFLAANEMHIPVGRPIQLTITAPNDGVIHSFWVPELNGKKDAVPGREEPLRFEADAPGTYLGQCAEYCGLSHADMRLRVIAMPENEYEQWVAEQKAPLGAQQQAFVDSTLGEKWTCTNCHALSSAPGEGATIGPNLTRVGDRTTFAAGTYDTNAGNLADWVHDAPSMKSFGDYQNAMPSFASEGMTIDEAREIAEFLCSTASDAETAQACLDGTGDKATGLRE
jgi:cytochrome c oxidase subunit 2